MTVSEPITIADSAEGREVVHRVELPMAPPSQTATVTGSLVREGNGERLYGVKFKGIGRAPFRTSGSRFTISGLPPGERRITVQSRDFESVVLPVTELEPGETLDVGEIRVRPACRVDVVVVDGDGKRIKGARVRLRRLPAEKGGRDSLPQAVRLKDDVKRLGPGVYRAEGVGHATWRLVVEHRSKKRNTREIRIAGQRKRVRVQLTDN